ncbi:MAG: Glycerate kinase [Pseudarthrobacter sp.]|nr:Glycerate kinase [Pseudarthrobacter sp.]
MRWLVDDALAHGVATEIVVEVDSRRLTGEGSIDEQTLAGKLPAAVARRSGARRIIAVAGRSLLPQERWSDLALTNVYTLAGYTELDSSKDPELSAALLQRIGQDIGASLL